MATDRSCEHCGRPETQAPRHCDFCRCSMCFECTEQHDEHDRCPIDSGAAPTDEFVRGVVRETDACEQCKECPACDALHDAYTCYREANP